MAISNFLSQTLILTTASSTSLFSASTPRSIRLFSASTPRSIRLFSAQSGRRLHVDLTAEMKAKVVKKIEDHIHALIVKRCKPDWLTFVPGASYWVPPRRSNYGISDLVDKIVNELTDEEYLSLVTLQGWPSSEFYIQDDEPSQSSSTETSSEPIKIIIDLY